MAPPISIVVPTRDRRESLLALLRGLADLEGEGVTDVVVVDNLSNDGTAEAVHGESWPFPVTVVDNPSRTRASARNRGAAAAKGEVLLFFDDDMTVMPGTVAAHARAHEEDPGAVFVGTPTPHPDVPRTMANRYLLRRWERIIGRLAQGGDRLPWGLLLTGHFSIARGLFERIGGFDEAFAAYSYEDSEFGLRLEKAGIPIRYLPDAVSWHAFDETIDSLARKAREEGASAAVFARLHPEVGAMLELHSVDRHEGTLLRRAAKVVLFSRVTRQGMLVLLRLSDGLLPDRMLFRILDYWLLAQREAGVRPLLRSSGPKGMAP